MTTMGYWFWAMSSYSWHAAGAAEREGEAEDHATQAQLPLDRLPDCTLKTLECMVRATDTIQLECLAWAVFHNVMGWVKCHDFPVSRLIVKF